MFISLIGMSGSGKSAWGKILERERGFKRYCCDDLIEEKLAPELTKLGYSGINDVSRWMGQPYDERYPETSRKYLDYEAESLREVLEEIKKMNKVDNVVVDTTGSVIYLPQELLEKLKKLTKIVYLKTPEHLMEEMIAKYVADPKPVIWGNLYQPKEGEAKEETLKRCYPDLLKYRAGLYEKLADLGLDYEIRRARNFTPDDFLKLAKNISKERLEKNLR